MHEFQKKDIQTVYPVLPHSELVAEQQMRITVMATHSHLSVHSTSFITVLFNAMMCVTCLQKQD